MSLDGKIGKMGSSFPRNIEIWRQFLCKEKHQIVSLKFDFLAENKHFPSLHHGGQGLVGQRNFSNLIFSIYE